MVKQVHQIILNVFFIHYKLKKKNKIVVLIKVFVIKLQVKIIQFVLHVLMVIYLNGIYQLQINMMFMNIGEMKVKRLHLLKKKLKHGVQIFVKLQIKIYLIKNYQIMIKLVIVVGVLVHKIYFFVCLVNLVIMVNMVLLVVHNLLQKVVILIKIVIQLNILLYKIQVLEI